METVKRQRRVKRKNTYPVLRPDEDGCTVDNTSINIDKTIKDIFKSACIANNISMYKALNLIVTKFILDTEKESPEKIIHGIESIEHDLIKIINDNFPKGIMKFDSLKSRQTVSIKVKVPKKVWLDFCRMANLRRVKQSIELTAAIIDRINKNSSDKDNG